MTLVWRDRLGKRPDINPHIPDYHSPAAPEPVFLYSEITVVIIFNDITWFFPQAIVLCPSQKFHAPFDRHHDPQRVLMGRHDKCNIRSGRFQLSDVHTFSHPYRLYRHHRRKLFKDGIGLHISSDFPTQLYASRPITIVNSISR